MIQQNPNINSYLRLQSNAIQWTLAFNSSFQMQMCAYLYEKLFMFSIAEICVLYIFANQTFDNKTPSDCYTFGYFDGNYGIAIAATQNRNTPKKKRIGTLEFAFELFSTASSSSISFEVNRLYEPNEPIFRYVVYCPFSVLFLPNLKKFTHS